MAYEPPAARGFSRSGFFLIVVLVGLLTAAAPAFAQRGSARMQGRVTDEAGTPIAGVTVVAFNPDLVPSTFTDTTNDNGRWAIMGLKANDVWDFTFTKEGFSDYVTSIAVRGQRANSNMDVMLEPIADDAGTGSVGAGSPGAELFTEGFAAMEAGDPVTAAAKYEEFLALNPDSHLVYGNLGNAYRDADDPEKARAAYQKLLDAEPDNAMANSSLGELLVETGEIQQAIPYFETVLSMTPDDPAVYYNVAELYFSQREMERAIRYYNRALEVDPAYLSAYAQLGFAQVNVGDIAAAIVAFEKYVEIAPEDDPQLPVIKDVLAALKGGTM